LEQHDVEEDLLEAILTTARSHAGADDIQAALVAAILSRVKFSGGIAMTDKPCVVALLGPTGVGKTTTTAKLAAHHRLQEQKRVGLVTMDTTRVGGSEQLQAYANIIDVPCVVAQTPHDVAEAIRAYATYDLVLIDTPGRSAADAAGLADLKVLLEAAQPHEAHLLVSATTRRVDLWETARGFQPLSPGRIVFTKLDETTAFGDILNFADHTQLPLSYFSTGQTVPDAIEAATADRLARLLVSERRPFYC
jgi:flagellar biosynthesis protein FlhF